ncbi:MAG: acyltransferase domain-containing protein [Chloroflexi bacterium]|nr:acyltransferase domain-containing protein [Acidobacteriota bacterium]MCA1587948.1 acyltransferase domain-containing protein [Chloroflexota bacterium]MCA1719573.1 acyltransferase domain-containing protein [Actinomycetota bacterium]
MTDVAVVGMACRLPGAANLGEYWENLHAGRESITFFDAEELIGAGVDRDLLRRPDYVRAAPVLDDPSLFDAEFFGYAPGEARLIDPQHRLFLECAWTAMEHAGHAPGGSVGVYAGSAMNSYLLFSGLLPRLHEDYLSVLTANDKDFLATRVSYKLDLTGPAITVQTACSTSLVAVHLAAQSLQYGECDLALAGGVSVRVPHRVGYRYAEGGIVSPDGHCRPFDAEAAGTIFGSGAGVVVLKRHADAIADRDTVHAVIKGSAVNNDGAAKAAYSAPSVTRQATAITEALGDADVDPATISYVEAHGTGTRIGDPIEVAALTEAFRGFTGRRGFCAIGSVKSNIGHLDAAAGVAGLIKTVLALGHDEIPASLHFNRPNPEIPFDDTPFRVNAELSVWPPGPRRAAVNSLGVGGTNAHVILEGIVSHCEADNLPDHSRPTQLVLVSARTATALDTATAALADHLDQDVADVARTTQLGRRHFRYRQVLVCGSGGREWSGRREATAADVVFMLPGQGAQSAGMGLALYRNDPVFRAEVDRCTELFELPTDILFGRVEGLDRTLFTQPAMFTIGYALAGLWASWGVRPAALIGHSIGELTAACIAGVFSLEDAVSVVTVRAQLMEDLPEGAMLAVSLPEHDVLSFVDDGVALAAVTGPSDCVVAGETRPVKELRETLEGRGVRCDELRVSRAFHSAMTDPVVDPFREHLRNVRLREPLTPFVSNVSGTWIRPEEATDPAYWARQLRQMVRLADGFRTLARYPVLLELGPGHTLCGIARRNLVAGAVTPSLDDPVGALGQLWLAGADIDWVAFDAGERRRRVALPTYPFERTRCWAEPVDGNTFSPAPALPSLPPVTSHPVAPSGTPVEAAVTAVWQAVLGEVPVRRTDNFYALGGHSMMLPDVVGRLSAVFRIDLPVLTLMEAPTVAELAERIEQVFRLSGGRR